MTEHESVAELLSEMTGRPVEDFIPEDMEVPDFEEQEIINSDKEIDSQ